MEMQMITFFHSPMSRSTVIAGLISEMDIWDRIDLRLVEIQRQDGSGRFDAANPHPEHKVPALLHDGHLITERGAVMIYLTTLFPGPMAPKVGTAAWGEMVSWLTWYQGVLEPVFIFAGAGISHPWLDSTFRDLEQATERVRTALRKGPYLLGDSISAADLLVHSAYAFFPDSIKDDALVSDWVARCTARPALVRAGEEDAARMAQLRAA
jgi:glutathione S-transferase